MPQHERHPCQRPGPSVPARRLLPEDGRQAVPLAKLPWVPDSDEHEAESKDPAFADLWGILQRRRRTIAAVFLTTVFVVSAWVLSTRPVYVATATLRIDKDEPRVLTFDEVVKQTDPLPDSLQTHQKLLQSRTLANRVIQLLSLDSHPDFQDQAKSQPWLARARTWVRQRLTFWPSPFAGSDPALTRDLTFESPLTQIFQDRLSVDSVRGSRLVKVSFESHDPVLATRLANAVGDTFIVQTQELRADTGRYASQFLRKQMTDAGAKLEAAEQKLNAFLKANSINFVGPAFLTGGNVAERQDLITQQLAVLSDALLKARSERIAKESLVVQARRPDPEALPVVLQSPLIVKLKGDLASLETSYKQLGQTFKPQYPRMQQLQQSINETRAQVRAEVRRIVRGLDADHRAALQNERQIERALEKQRAYALKLGDQLVAYNILRRDVDTGRELYTALLTRLKETQIATDLLTSPISIVDRAEVPLLPARPRRMLALLLASAAGLLGGLGAAVLMERFDRRIAKVEEVERLLGVPKLGLVPKAHCLCRGNAHRHRVAMETHVASTSQFAEFVRDLRTSILYATAGRPPRTFMVTSLEPGDGKTSLSMNLAVAMAQRGAGEILLIDGDLRHPELHAILNVRRSPGLSSFLEGHAELSAVLTPTDVPNLSVIPAGRNPANPAELLGSRRLDEALAVLSERFEHIIFDTAPLFSVSDTLNLAPRLDGVLLVLRHGRARRDDAQEAVQRLWSVRAKLLGVVVNDVDRDALRHRRAYYSAGRNGTDAEIVTPDGMR